MPKPATDKNYTGTCSPPECISAERKTVLRIFLAAFAVLLLFLFAAAPASAYSGGTGLSSDPYNISTAADLKQLATDVNGGTDYTGAYFKVTADIDLSSICNVTSDESWEPIGNSSTGSPFAGHFDGGGKIIANLFIDSSEIEQGLFGRTESGSSVKNVSLINATVSGGDYTGSLIGYADGSSVSCCYAVSNVSGESGESGVGGLIGMTHGSSVSCCYAVSNVTGNGSVGGLIGMTQGSSVSCCYAAGTVSGNDNIGGLIGEVNDCSVEYCAALNSEVKGVTVGKVAGFVSEHTHLNNNYAWENMRVSRSSSGGDGESVSSADIWANISFYRDVLDWTIGDTSLWQIVGFDDGVSYPLPYLWTMPDRAAAADLKPEPVLSEVTLEASDSTPNTQTVSIWTENVTFNETVTVPVRHMFSFTGWYNESGVRVVSNTGALVPDVWGYTSADGKWMNRSTQVTLFARWIQMFNVTFNPNNSTSPVTWNVSVSYGETVAEPDTPVYSGHTLNGWTKPDGTSWDFNTQVTKDITLTANWTANPAPVWNVTFNPNNSTPPVTWNVSVSDGAKVAIPDTPVYRGHTLNGWMKQGSTQWNFTTPVTEDITLTASWTANQTEVTFLNYTGGTDGTVTLTFGEQVTQVSVPYKAGFIFGGYFAENNLTGTRVFDADGKPVIADGYITEGGAWDNTSDTLALHAGWTAVWQGSGTESDPYQIKTAGNLTNLSIFVNNGNSYSGTYFRLMNDIDLSGYESWTPIGSGAPITGSRIAFEGSFNGSGYAITGLTINDPDNDYAGLFGYISNAEIRNLNLTVKNVTGGENVGALVGSASAYGGSVTIDNCYATGDVTGSMYAGGLVGSASALDSGSVTIENCYATGDVNGSMYAGGLVGSASASASAGYSSIRIENCYATGDVNGIHTGGLVGSASASTLSGGSSITIENCYATGDVTGSDSAGGLVGSAYTYTWIGSSISIENCAALNPRVSGSGSVGRIAGQTSGTVNINNAYALSTMSPGSATDGKAVSPENAASQSFYNDTLKWDFGEIWKMDADISRYPVLQIQSGNSPTVTPIVNPTVTPIVNPTAIPIPEDGTVGSPYRIDSASDLARVAGLVNAGDAQYNAANYIVTQDIDLSLYSSWTPIGNKTHPFKGSFNGSGYAITGLTINDPDIKYAGLFGYIQNAEIRNINLTVKNVTGSSYAGGLVGYAYAYSGGSVSIKNCYATGSVTATGNCSYSGGLVGYACAYSGGSVSIKNCYATGDVTGVNNAGGLVGYADAKAGGSISIKNCYATGSVNGSHAGGLVGYASAYGGSVTIDNCYATGDVTGSMYAGGLVGSASALDSGSVTIENCYATGSVNGDDNAGGLVGSAYASTLSGCSLTIENCAALNPSVSGSGSVGRIAGIIEGTVNINNAYALSTMSSGSATDDKVVSPENAASQSFYKDTLKWDFDDIWNIDADISRYPYLRMNIPNAQPVKIISYVDGAIGAVIISENPVPDDLSLTVNEVPDKDALTPLPAEATLVRVYDFTLHNAPDGDYQCILNIPLTIYEMNKIPRKTLQGYHDENGKWVPCDTETIMNSDGSAIAYVKAKGFSAYMIAAVTPAVPVEYSGGSSTDTGSGNFNEYPRTVTDGGFVSFGTSPTVSSVDLPKGVSGSVILVVESKTPAPDGKPTYTVFEINIPNYPEGEEAVIQFRITLEELKKAGYDAEDICLYHCDENGVWTALPTTFTIKDGVVYYESVTTAFSPFAIVYEENGAAEVSQPAVTPVKTQTAEPVQTYVEPTKTAVPTAEQTKSPVGLLGLGLGLLGAAAVLRRK